MARPQPYDADAGTTRPEEESAWETPSGLVVMYAPTWAVPYYRIVWGTPQHGTSACRVFDRAWDKALAREQLLLEGATPKTEFVRVGRHRLLAVINPAQASR